MSFKSLFYLLIGSFFFIGCGGSNDPLPIETFQTDKLNAIESFWVPTSSTFVIRNKATYDAFTANYWQADSPPPEIDFAENMLLGVSYGDDYSGCSSDVDVIGRVSIVDIGNSPITVSVNRLPSLGPCDAVIAPLDMVLMPKRAENVVFVLSPPDIEPSPLPFTYLPDFEKFSVSEPGIVVYKDQQAWLDLWEQSWTESDANGRTPPPEVDFSQKMVIAVFYGQGFSGCSARVELIEAVEETCPVACADNQLRLRLKSLPEDLGDCREAITPLSMIVVDRNDLELLVEGPSPN